MNPRIFVLLFISLLSLCFWSDFAVAAPARSMVTTSMCDTAPRDGCCSPRELTPHLRRGVLRLGGNMKLCPGTTYRFPIEIRDVSGTPSNPITLDCSNSLIWGGDDLGNLKKRRFGLRVIAMKKTEEVDFIDIRNCVVAGWHTGIFVTKRHAPVRQSKAPIYPRLTLVDPSDGSKHIVFDHRDMPLPDVPRQVNLTNITAHRNGVGLNYRGRNARILGLRAYQNRGHGVHLAPHSRNIVFDRSNASPFAIYDNGHRNVPSCASGMFSVRLCGILNRYIRTLNNGIAIDSAHNITIKNGLIRNNGRHGISIYKNCGEHMPRERAYHRRSLLDRNIQIINMKISGHMNDYNTKNYLVSFEMVTSAGIMIGSRQGLKLRGQDGCHDLSSYVFTGGRKRDHWTDISYKNRRKWHHWDFAQGVTIKGGAISDNIIGVHVADSRTNFIRSGPSSIKFQGNRKADIFVGNFQRDRPGNLILSNDDRLIGISPVKDIDLSGVISGAHIVCTRGTRVDPKGVLHGRCTAVVDCIEELVRHKSACGVR